MKMKGNQHTLFEISIIIHTFAVKKDRKEIRGLKVPYFIDYI